jgi:hypothetical protein
VTDRSAVRRVPSEGPLIDLDSVLLQRERVLVQQADADAVLLDVDTGSYFSLNDVGGRVWALCDGRTVAEIVDVICSEFDAPVETIRADVLELLGALHDEKLVVES